MSYSSFAPPRTRLKTSRQRKEFTFRRRPLALLISYRFPIPPPPTRILRGAVNMLHSPCCSPSTSRAIKMSGVNYIPPGIVNPGLGNVNIGWMTTRHGSAAPALTEAMSTDGSRRRRRISRKSLGPPPRRPGTVRENIRPGDRRSISRSLKLRLYRSLMTPEPSMRFIWKMIKKSSRPCFTSMGQFSINPSNLRR
jgi:hypothetical protein